MSSVELGTGHLAVVPSFRGFRKAMNKETDAAGKESARGFGKAMGRGSQVAGGQAGRGFARGFKRSASVSTALKGLNDEVRKAASKIGAARDVERTAAGRVRVAEAQLAEARKKYAADSSQVIRAEERLAGAQRKSVTARDNLKGATDRLTQAQRTLQSAQAANATVGRGGGFFAALKGHVSKARAEMQGLSTSTTGFARASAGGLTAASSSLERFRNGIARAGQGFGVLAGAGAGMARSLLQSVAPVGGQIASALGRGFQAAVSAAGRAASSIAHSFTNVVGAVTTGAAVALAGSVTAGFGRLRVVEDATAMMRGFGLEADVVERVMGDVGKAVEGTFFLTGDMAQAAAQALVAGVKPGKELNDVMSALASTAAGTKSPLSDIQNIMGSVISGGRAYTGDLQQLQQRGVPVWTMLADEMGVTADEVRNLASEGKVSADILITALNKTMGDMATEMAATTTGALMNARAAFGQFGETLLAQEFPIVQAIANAVTQVVYVARELIEPLKAAFGLDGVGPAVEKINEFSQRMIELRERIAEGDGFVAGLVARIKELAPVFAIVAAAAVPLMAGFLSGLPVIGGLFAALGPSLLGGLLPLLAGGGIIGMLGMDPAAFAGAVTGIVGAITSGIGSALSTVADLLSELVPLMAENLTANAPVLAEGVRQLLLGLVNVASSAVPSIVASLVQLVPALVTALVSMLPALLQGGVQLALAILTGLVSAIPQIVTALTGAIPQLIATITSALPLLIDGALQLFLGLVTGLVTALPQILTAIISAVPLIVTSLVGMVPQLIQGGLQLFLGLVLGLVQAIPQVIVALIGAIPQIVAALASALPQIVLGAVQLFLGLVTGLIQSLPQIIEAVIGAVPQIVTALIDATPQLVAAGGDLIAGLVDGILGAGHLVLDAIGGVVDGAIGWAKDLLGIASPSKVFREIGDFTGQGLARGMEGTAGRVRSSAKKLVDTARSAFDGLAEHHIKAPQVDPLSLPDLAGASGRSAGLVYGRPARDADAASRRGTTEVRQENHFEGVDPEVAMELGARRLATLLD